MKTVFLCRDTHYEYPLIAKALAEEFGVENYALVLSSKTYNVLLNKYPNSFKKIYNLDNFFYLNNDFSEIAIKDKIAFLISIEQRLNIPSIYSLIYVDRILTKYKYQDCISIAYGICRFLLEIFFNEKFDLVIGEIGTFLECLLWKFSFEKDFKYIHLSPARTGGRLVAIYGDAYDIVGFKETYESLKRSELTGEDRRLFEEFYAGYIESRRKPDYLKKKDLLEKTKNIVGAYLERKRYRNRSGYILESIDTSSIGQLVFLRLRKHLNRLLIYKVGRVFSPLPSSKYIFFPLHLDPELATLLLAPYYTNQLAVIENIAKSIPAGYRLVVKEHPNMYGLRGVSFYRALNRLPNVTVVHPAEDSHKIIKGSDAVVVITSTAGFEGILFEKPVFVLGNVFYGAYENARRVENIRTLPVLIREGLAGFRRDRDALARFVVSYMKCTYEGVMGNSLEEKRHLTAEGIKNFASVLFRAYSVEKKK
jgi:hypothetical protein